MAEPSQSSAASGTYAEGVKWMLAIAAAAIGGAFLHLKEVEEQIHWVQVLLGLSLVLFVVSVHFGTQYLLWFITGSVTRERLAFSEAQLRREQSPRNPSPDPARVQELGAEIAQARALLRSYPQNATAWHRVWKHSFPAAFLFAIAGILLAMWHKAHAQPEAPKPGPAPVSCACPPAPVQSRFTVVYSAVHATRKGREAHTFLLNQQTGELWQMVCAPGGRVTFERVKAPELQANTGSARP